MAKFLGPEATCHFFPRRVCSKNRFLTKDFSRAPVPDVDFWKKNFWGHVFQSSTIAPWTDTFQWRNLKKWFVIGNSLRRSFLTYIDIRSSCGNHFIYLTSFHYFHKNWNWNSQLTLFPMCAFIAQMLKQRTGIAKVTISLKPEFVQASLISNCLNLKCLTYIDIRSP